MLFDKQVMSAVSRIRQRSEKQSNIKKLINTFVDIGIFPQIDNENNQIIYGRRGTGKTHILRILSAKLQEDKSNIVSYVDCRNLGSTAQFSDPQFDIKHRCLSLFKDILNIIHDDLLEYVVEQDENISSQSLEILDEMSSIMIEPYSSYQLDSITQRSLGKSRKSAGIGLTVSFPLKSDFKINDTSSDSAENESTKSFKVLQEDKVIFPSLNTSMKKLLVLMDSKFYLIIDEWSSIPIEIQPYLAEFLKRSFFANNRIIIKIATLEYRSNFSKLNSKTERFGFELGSDIATGLDIDDYYVFDRNPKLVSEIFANMLFKHLKSELPENYLENTYEIRTIPKFNNSIFAAKFAFLELVRASEGVARDLINIFTNSYFNSQRKGKKRITRDIIIESSHIWFEQDKAKNLDNKLREYLEKIVTEIVGIRKIRYFMLPRELEKNIIIQQLFDARVLHLVERGSVYKSVPTKAFNTYTLDYGTYAKLFTLDKKNSKSYRDINKEEIIILPGHLIHESIDKKISYSFNKYEKESAKKKTDYTDSEIKIAILNAISEYGEIKANDLLYLVFKNQMMIKLEDFGSY